MKHYFCKFFFSFKVRNSVKHCQGEGYVLQFLVLKWSKKITIYSNDQQTRKIVKDSIDCLVFIYRIDYGLSNTDRLYEYISARMYGEHTGDCESAYPQCPFSAFNLIGEYFLYAYLILMKMIANWNFFYFRPWRNNALSWQPNAIGILVLVTLLFISISVIFHLIYH